MKQVSFQHTLVSEKGMDKILMVNSNQNIIFGAFSFNLHIRESVSAHSL